MHTSGSFFSAEPVGDRYELSEQVGEGTFSVTYRARDLLLRRTVAVKVLRAHHAADSTFVQRFEREARLAAAVDHPNVVNVYDYGRHRDTFYIVMQFVPGQTLKQALDTRGRFESAAAVRLMAQVLRGLAAIHAAGIIHRDIKPQNILVSADGSALVTDFGVAFFPSDGSLTSTGTTIGTASYMAPEQARGGVLSEATDLYAVGVVLYELLTGHLPFVADNPIAVMVAHVQQPPPAPRERNPETNLPPALERELMRTLAKDPRQRHASAAALATALELAVGLVTAEAPGESAETTVRLPVLTGEPVVAPGASRSAREGGPASRSRPAPADLLPPRPSRRSLPTWLAPALILAVAMIAIGALTVAGGLPGLPAASTPAGSSLAALPPSSPNPSATSTRVMLTTPVPTARRSPTAVPPTSTLDVIMAPTATPASRSTRTATPLPTATPRPTRTVTPAPTMAPTSTATPAPIPTAELPPTIAPREQPPGVLVFAAREWRGGQDCGRDVYERPCVAIFGGESDLSRATLHVELDDPPTERLVLILTGLGDPTGKAFPFAIEVNGIASKKVPVEFINWDPAGASGGASPPWAVVQLSLDVDLFQAGRNEIAIVSLASGNASDEPPFLLISDAIVAPTSLVDAALAQSEVASLDLGSVRPEFSGDPKNDDKGNEKDRNKGNDNKPKEPGKDE